MVLGRRDPGWGTETGPVSVRLSKVQGLKMVGPGDPESKGSLPPQVPC